MKLGDVCKFQNGFAFKSSAFSNRGDYNIIKIKELKDGEVRFFDDSARISDFTERLSPYIVNNGDILFALTGDPVNKNNPLSWVGRISRYNHPKSALLNQRVCKAIVDDSKLDKDYLFYYFRLFGNFYSLAQKATGSANQANISTTTIENIEIDLPDMETQRTIAATLSAIDDKIAVNRALNHNLEQMAQAIFKSWFVEFEPWGGVMPGDWQEGTLSEIANITMGQSPDGASYNEDGIGTVFYQGRAEFGFRFPARRLFTTQPKRMAAKGNVLMSVRAPVGDLNVAFEPCCLGRGLAGIQSNNDCQSFVLYTLFALKQHLDMFNGEGTVFGSINKSDMANLYVLIPSDKAIHQFEEAVRPMDSAIKTNFAENCNLKDIRDSLLPRLMSGDIKIKKGEHR